MTKEKKTDFMTEGILFLLFALFFLYLVVAEVWELCYNNYAAFCSG